MEFMDFLFCGGVPVIPVSETSTKILSRVVAIAKERNHSIVGTEHLLLAICQISGSRAVAWVAAQCEGMTPESMLDIIQGFLDRSPMFSPVADCVGENISFSSSFKRAIEIAQKIGGGPVRDGEITYENGLIASEFLLAGILVEGTGLGAEALTRFSGGKVNSREILRAIKVSDAGMEKILAPRSTRPWESVTIPTAGSSLAQDSGDWVPPCLLRDINLPESPNSISNWLIPGKLIIGSHPSDSRDDVRTLVAAGVDTFVSLIGEYTFEKYQSTKYPAQIIQQACFSSPKPINCLHFPIRDFDVVAPETIDALVKELKKRLTTGSTIFVHCRGGHG